MAAVIGAYFTPQSARLKDSVIDDTTARFFTNSKNCIQHLMLKQHLTNGNTERHLGMLFMIQQQTV